MTSGNDLIIAVENVDEVRMEIQDALQEKYFKLSAFTDGLPWDLKRYIDAARKDFQAHAHSGISLGRRLIVMKEMLAHGEFLNALKEIHKNFSERTARNYMGVAAIFSGLDPETISLLGLTKLYSMLRAPSDEIEKFISSGTFLGNEKDSIVQMSSRELDQLVKDATEKIKLALEETRIKTDQLSEEVGHLKKEKRQLEKQLSDAKAGAPPEDKLPEYWNEYTAVLAALTAFSAKLAQHPNDFDDAQTSARCEVMRDRIEHEWAHCRKFISNGTVDPVAFQQRRQEKIHDLRQSGKFDFSKLEE